MKNIIRFCILLSLTIALSPMLLADVLFSQGVNSDGTFPNGGFDIAGADFQYFGYQSVASHFTLDADAVLSRIDIGLAYITGITSSSRDVLIKLEGNDPSLGIPNGLAITSGVVSATAPLDNSSVAPTSFLPSSSTVALTAGETYWVVAEPVSPSTADVWTTEWTFYTDRSVCTFARSSDGINYTAAGGYDFPAFQVIGTQVPEPSSALLLFCGAFFLLRCRNPKPNGRNA